jgi:uncharacterized protein (DUF362 family)
MEGDGAVYGILKKVGMLIAEKNALTTDLVGLELVEFPGTREFDLKRAPVICRL